MTVVAVPVARATPSHGNLVLGVPCAIAAEAAPGSTHGKGFSRGGCRLIDPIVVYGARSCGFTERHALEQRRSSSGTVDLSSPFEIITYQALDPSASRGVV